MKIINTDLITDPRNIAAVLVMGIVGYVVFRKLTKKLEG